MTKYTDALLVGRCKCHVDLLPMDCIATVDETILLAIADAHAAGFAEAIKMAANVVDERARAWTGAPVGSPNHLYRLEAIAIRDEIRALAPAKTETPK